MKIDDTHSRWRLTSVVILAVAVAAYIPYAWLTPGGARGNSVPGLIYGVIGYSMMLFAGLMGARKKRPLWRVGRAQFWMRGHLWLGALSLPIIAMHAGFVARGPLTLVLAVLLTIVWLSGLTGAVIQHFVPRRMTSEVPLETIYQDIPNIREQLRTEAAGIVERLCADTPAGSLTASAFDKGRAVIVAEDEDPGAGLGDQDRIRLREVYNNGILPFLRDPEAGLPLGVPGKAAAFFKALRIQSPESIHKELGELEQICEEQRQLTRQKKIYLLMHGWLLVHVPLSVTLLVLGAIHAVMAIRY